MCEGDQNNLGEKPPKTKYPPGPPPPPPGFLNFWIRHCQPLGHCMVSTLLKKDHIILQGEMNKNQII